MLSEMSVKDARNEIHETAYEYEEWGIMSDWVPMTTPGRYISLPLYLRDCTTVMPTRNTSFFVI